MTGAALQKCLMEKTPTAPDIQIHEYCQALDLIIDDESEPRTVLGACALDIRGERLIAFGARMVVLATGGSGKVYLYTTNPDVATGDGLAMGVRAGARAANMEFFQFHPTCLYHPEMR
jgi:L-aspartate oxidase